jgi:hypothetical protein
MFKRLLGELLTHPGINIRPEVAAAVDFKKDRLDIFCIFFFNF